MVRTFTLQDPSQLRLWSPKECVAVVIRNWDSGGSLARLRVFLDQKYGLRPSRVPKMFAGLGIILTIQSEEISDLCLRERPLTSAGGGLKIRANLVFPPPNGIVSPLPAVVNGHSLRTCCMTLVQKLAILCLPKYESVKTGRRSPFYLNCSHIVACQRGGVSLFTWSMVF